MKTIVARNRKVQIIEQPDPEVLPSYLLIETTYSAISPGTELGLIDISADKDLELGYSAVGNVLACGENVVGFQEGDIVACYGAPYVGHREKLLVPTTLCAKVPKDVDVKEGSLAGIGAIAIHALRIAKLSFGETVVIVGLGLLGQMIAKIANAAAYNVIAFDIQADRVDMIQRDKGIAAFSSLSEMENELLRRTNNQGADAVLLCSGGKRSELTDYCLNWVRKQGKVVIVGDIEPVFPRDQLFAKEAQILISRAGGPGRYDSVYEKQSIDYPYGYVRWTEGRNVAEYIRLISNKMIDVKPFLQNEVDFKDVPVAYDELIELKQDMLTQIINYKN
ncbi:zinc-binding alcohol dehydrogenase [Sporosarcina sp. 6E9]|uniref:zinc-dependent alcohol dehydrogenase n=1 Tax=Sporosarcina sp. 6E9 TaxID=2819235 RepID=UPI001B30246D|nr:zinc-binding alcohol dehydrogenase [Sporosarcina sp. 6E9]